MGHRGYQEVPRLSGGIERVAGKLAVSQGQCGPRVEGRGAKALTCRSWSPVSEDQGGGPGFGQNH